MPPRRENRSTTRRKPKDNKSIYETIPEDQQSLLGPSSSSSSSSSSSVKEKQFTCCHLFTHPFIALLFVIVTIVIAYFTSYHPHQQHQDQLTDLHQQLANQTSIIQDVIQPQVDLLSKDCIILNNIPFNSLVAFFVS